MAFLEGFVADLAKVRELTGRNVDPRIQYLQPTGHRLVVLKDLPVDESEGGILIPDTAQEELGGGLVVSVGPLVGQGPAPHPVGLLCDTPQDLLYKHVIFGQWVGHVLKLSVMDREFETKNYWVLTDRDIWMVDENPIERRVT